MNLFVIGLNHRSAPVELRERLAFAKASVGEATARLLEAAHLHEAAVLSTCNRVEIYGLAGSAAEAAPAVRRFLHEHHKLVDSVDAYLYEHRDNECIEHLLKVACGLDSMVLGETEILGQVKDAYHTAQQAGATGVVLNRLFQKVFSAAKHIRSTTAITRGSTSVGTVAVDLAEKIFGKLGKCTVMVIGTGEMSEVDGARLAEPGRRGDSRLQPSAGTRRGVGWSTPGPGDFIRSMAGRIPVSRHRHQFDRSPASDRHEGEVDCL